MNPIFAVFLVLIGSLLITTLLYVIGSFKKNKEELREVGNMITGVNFGIIILCLIALWVTAMCYADTHQEHKKVTQVEKVEK